MVLTRRTRPAREGIIGNTRPDGAANRNWKKNRAAFVPPLIIVTVTFALGRIIFKPHLPPNYPAMPDNAVRLEEKVGLSLNFAKASRKNVTLGPHEVSLAITKRCEDPKFVLRLLGEEALVSIPIVQVDKYRWKGTFQIPFPGNYIVEPRWYGCEPIDYDRSDKKPLDYKGESSKISVSGRRETKRLKRLSETHSSLSDLFPEGFWVSPTLYGDMENKHLWITRAMGLEQPNFLSASTALGTSLVAKEALPIRREFGDLSNYELLCWVGSHSAALLWEAFKSLRAGVAKHQKPFKFHYYPIDNFVQPDREWDDELKLRFRKCKNVIISLDELPFSITQEEYRKQVSTFLDHLVKMFEDDSFPIWMLTVNLNPVSASPMCTSPKKRTNHHPCNDALFDIFSSKIFPDRVRLLDNTDVTDPLLDEDLKDAAAVIAMRIFAIAGDQVKTWRKANQKGVKEFAKKWSAGA